MKLRDQNLSKKVRYHVQLWQEFKQSSGSFAHFIAVFRKKKSGDSVAGGKEKISFKAAIPSYRERTCYYKPKNEVSMRSFICALCLAIAALAGCGSAFAEDGILVIHAANAEDEPVAGVVFSSKLDGTRSAPTDSAGITRMALPKAARPNDWIHLQVLKGTAGNDDWILISPWDGRVAVPPFDNKPDRFVLVVVAKKFDKHLLADPIALRAMAATASSELAPKTPGKTISEEQRRAVLAEVAKGYGLGVEEIDQAIRTWGEKSKDPYEIGLAALYVRNYPLAGEQLAKSLEIREAELEKQKAQVADTASFLGQSFNKQGKYQESVNAYRKALASRPDDATIMNDLGLALTNAGHYSEAEPLSKRALEIREKTLGSDHPDVANSLNNLAELYHIQGKYAEAEPLFKRALAIQEKALGLDHPDVAITLNNLAKLYYSQGKYVEAEPLFKRALAIQEKALGLNHPDVAITLNNLAALYYREEKYAAAEPLFKRTLEITERVLGPSHPGVASSLNNLAELYRIAGKYAEAELLFKRALDIDEKALGSNHLGVATDLNNLANLYYRLERYTEAEPLFKRVLEINEKALGADHLNVANSLNNLAGLYRAKGDYAKAESLYIRALAIYEKTLGKEHPLTATLLNNLAALYNAKGDYAKAEPLYIRELAIREKALGAEHLDTASSLNNLAELYRAKGDYAKAEPLFKRALAIYEKALGPDHLDVARVLENYAILLRKTNRESEAAAMETRAKAIRARHQQKNPKN